MKNGDVVRGTGLARVINVGYQTKVEIFEHPDPSVVGRIYSAPSSHFEVVEEEVEVDLRKLELDFVLDGRPIPLGSKEDKEAYDRATMIDARRNHNMEKSVDVKLKELANATIKKTERSEVHEIAKLMDEPTVEKKAFWNRVGRLFGGNK